MKETHEQFQARTYAVGLDHLVHKIMLNADTVYASRTLREAGEQGVLARAPQSTIDDFLDRLLPALEAREKLPPQLVPMMIREFHWPDSVPALEGATGLRSDVRELLQRLVRESGIEAGGDSLVPRQVDNTLLWRAVVVAAFGIALFVAVVLARSGFRDMGIGR